MIRPPAQVEMLWADTSSGVPKSKDPSVIRFGGRYLMYFSMPPKPSDTRWGQGVAESTDLTNWRTVREIARGICAADAIIMGGRVHLFYQSYGGGVNDSICHAVSDDGINFDISTSPIFRPTGDWTCGRAIDAEARIVGSELFVYWATRDPAYKVQMLGVHSAPLSSDFSAEHWRQRCTSSILKPKLAWEKNCIEAPSIIARTDSAGNRVFVMFYAGAYNSQPQQIGVAFSRDGLMWTRMSAQPFLRDGAAGTWNSDESGHPAIFLDAVSDGGTGKTWLFYQGTNDRRKTYYLSKRQIKWDGHIPRLA